MNIIYYILYIHVCIYFIDILKLSEDMFTGILESYPNYVLGWIFIVLTENIIRSTRTHYTDSEPNSLFINAVCVTKKQQIPFYSLWFDLTGARTPDLPHFR
jgi:hypothetical protein